MWTRASQTPSTFVSDIEINLDSERLPPRRHRDHARYPRRISIAIFRASSTTRFRSLARGPSCRLRPPALARAHSIPPRAPPATPSAPDSPAAPASRGPRVLVVTGIDAAAQDVRGTPEMLLQRLLGKGHAIRRFVATGVAGSAARVAQAAGAGAERSHRGWDRPKVPWPCDTCTGAVVGGASSPALPWICPADVVMHDGERELRPPTEPVLMTRGRLRRFGRR